MYCYGSWCSSFIIPSWCFICSVVNLTPFATNNLGSKPKAKVKREKTEEEKKYRKRAKYFVATQLVAVLVFLTFLRGSDDDGGVELGDDDDDVLDYE